MRMFLYCGRLIISVAHHFYLQSVIYPPFFDGKSYRLVLCGMVLYLFLSLFASVMCGWKGALFLIAVIVAREVWQNKVYHLPCFEWEDVVRYSFVILLGYLVRMLSVECWIRAYAFESVRQFNIQHSTFYKWKALLSIADGRASSI